MPTPASRRRAFSEPPCTLCCAAADCRQTRWRRACGPPASPSTASRPSPRRSKTSSSTSWTGPAVRKALAVYRKELRQIRRDRRTLMTIVFVPAFFLLLYGYALNWDIRHIALAVQDRDQTASSRALVSAFVNSGYFD